MGKLFFLAVCMLSSMANANIPDNFTVGTYNLHGLEDEINLRRDLTALPQVQIWAFQEVEDTFTGGEEDRISRLLPSGKWYVYGQRVNSLNARGLWEGQVIASRFPAESIEVIDLNHTNKKARIALVANFKTNSGKNFFFANTDHEVDVFSTDFNDRKKQLESLVENFNKTNTAGIITGDFNTTGGSLEISKTEDVLQNASFQRATPLDEDPYTFQKLFIKKELDHFFTRGLNSSLRYRYSERKGSDHFPIYIHIDL